MANFLRPSLRIFSVLFGAHVGIYLAYEVSTLTIQSIAGPSSPSCLGWECEDKVVCPDGYAIKVPNKGFLPCESWDDYFEENESSKYLIGQKVKSESEFNSEVSEKKLNAEFLTAKTGGRKR